MAAVELTGSGLMCKSRDTAAFRQLWGVAEGKVLPWSWEAWGQAPLLVVVEMDHCSYWIYQCL